MSSIAAVKSAARTTTWIACVALPVPATAGIRPGKLNELIDFVLMNTENVGTEFPAELTVTRADLAGAPAFVGYVRDITDRQRAERDGRVHADGEGHRQRLTARLGDLVKLPEVLAEREVDRRGVAALEHEPVVGAVPDLARRVFREGDRRR